MKGGARIDLHLPDQPERGVDSRPRSAFPRGGRQRAAESPDWGLFGLEAEDALSELRRLSLRGELIVQSAGGITQVSWKYKSMEDLADAIAQS